MREADATRATVAFIFVAISVTAGGLCSADSIRAAESPEATIEALVRDVEAENLATARYEKAVKLDSVVQRLSEAQSTSFSEASIRRISSLLTDRVEIVRTCAADALGHIGPPAVSALPLLMKVLDEINKARERELLKIRERAKTGQLQDLPIRTGPDLGRTIESALQRIERFPVSELNFREIMATRGNDQSVVYCPLAGGYLLSITSDNAVALTTNWLADHPDATVRMASRMLVTRTQRGRPAGHLVSVWIDDGPDSLNLYLVREGAYLGSAMMDAVEKLGLTHTDGAPNDADEERPQRLVSDADYAAFMDRVWAAQGQAKYEKRGLWADRYKSDREALGVE